MTLEPEIRAFVARSLEFLAPGYQNEPIAARRRRYAELCRAYDLGRPAGLEVRDLAIPGPLGAIPARLYRRPVPSEQAGLVYLHGGSWYLGGLDSHDSIVAELAELAAITVIAVDYRLAPEHRFPAACDDALAALDWVAAHAAALAIDPARLGVGGDSAGGNLAAGLALAARDRGAPRLKAQLLVYPLLDRHDPAGDPGAAGAPLLAAEEIRFAIRCYAGADALPADPRAVPCWPATSPACRRPRSWRPRPTLCGPMPSTTRRPCGRPAWRSTSSWPMASCTVSSGPAARARNPAGPSPGCATRRGLAA